MSDAPSLPQETEASRPLAEPVAWLWTHNGHVNAFTSKPPPSMLADPQCQPLYLAAPQGTEAPSLGATITDPGQAPPLASDGNATEHGGGSTNLGAGTEASTQPADSPIRWNEAAVDEYIEDYEMEDYTPRGHERALIKDAIMGLPGSALASLPEATAQAPALSERAAYDAWFVEQFGESYIDLSPWAMGFKAWQARGATPEARTQAPAS